MPGRFVFLLVVLAVIAIVVLSWIIGMLLRRRAGHRRPGRRG